MKECPCMETKYRKAVIDESDIATTPGGEGISIKSGDTNTKKLRPFTFPSKGVTVMAENLKDALKKLEESIKSK